ncbi:glycosyltransferase [Aquipluma nitroreducens]|uniref:Glycosyltransferase n=1 Tax=Aquipluma nitroreducens TaxID=2010828 RepID=A0A5K7S403_9BACT|nr:glycosyltransferase family A protein [Aquipluma nitroreducens]BBE16229.1 glycosyltransferase [Aquipluma nitroreducens]
MKHIVITPVYNEEFFLNTYIHSIINQSLRPNELILVDDNSSDNSSLIIQEFAEHYPWISYIFHQSMNHKAQGGKVINAFNYGLEQTDLNDVDFISKIDADLELPPNYFMKIGQAFKEDSKVGICGGIIQELQENQWINIRAASYHIRGALKSYRRECFEQIGGLIPVLGWDGLDEMKAMHKKWTTKTIDSSVKHFRPASKDYDPVKLNYERGAANFLNGGNLFLAIIRSIVKCKKKPFIKVAFSFANGYLALYLKKDERNVDPALAKFINQFHFKRLLKLRRY